MKLLLEVKNLSICFQNKKEEATVCRNISFSMYDNDILGIVGESGCGKTVTAQALLKNLSLPRRRLFGDILFHKDPMRIGYIFQDSSTSLNPTMRIGKQINEMLKDKAKALQLIGQVGLPATGHWYNKYPHELSGGEKQRVSIAVALSTAPNLLIADEPTTALDVGSRSLILDLLKSLQVPLLIISHDFNVIARICNRVLVMYGGRIVEEGTGEKICRRPQHPYTRALLLAQPGAHIDGSMPLTSIEGAPPLPSERHAGCNFAPRCQEELPICRTTLPPFEKGCACWLKRGQDGAD